MTSDEIRAAIDRLKAIPCDNTPSIFNMASALMDTDLNGSYTVIGLRNRLIGLLEQADPDNHAIVDVDGVPIHEGDTVYSTTNCKKLVVKDIFMCVSCAYITLTANGEYIDEVGYDNYTPDALTHRKPTIESVLREFGDEVQRCCDTEDTIAEYAAKLRELMADE